MNVYGNASILARFKDSDGNEYELVMPNVDLQLEPVIERGSLYGEPDLYFGGPDFITHMKLSGNAYRGKDSDSIVTIRLIKKGKPKKVRRK